MTFPADLLDLRFKLALGADPNADSTTWAWTDITDQVLVRAGATITRGRPDEASQTAPTTIAITVKNTNGQFSPRNPNGPYFGQLRRNTPLEVELRRARDAFGRTVSNGWGSADSGEAWTTTGGVAGDYSVSTGKGRQNHPSANVAHRSMLNTISLADVDVTMTFSTSVLAAGAPTEVGILARHTDANNFYWLLARLTTTQTMEPRIMRMVGGSGSVYTGGTNGPTHAAGTEYKMRARVVGSSLKVKLWAAASSEPTAWNLEVTDTQVTAAAPIGVLSQVNAGGTVPQEVRIDDFACTVNRGLGFVSEWPARWDLSGADSHMPLVANGVTRRMGQGASPLRSAMTRGIGSDPNLVAYWPMEDGESTTRLAAAVPGVEAATWTGVLKPGASAEPGAASAPVAILSPTTELIAPVPDHTTTSWTVAALFHIPEEPAAKTRLMEWRTKGTPAVFRLSIETFIAGESWNLVLDAMDINGVIAWSNTAGGAKIGEWFMVFLAVTQSGGNINYDLYNNTRTQVGGLFNQLDAGTVGAVKYVRVAGNTMLDGAAMGHLLVTDSQIEFGTWDHADAFIGYEQERATSRLTRLAAEQADLILNHVGVVSSSRSSKMGREPIKTALELLREVEDADGGILYEDRWSSALNYLQHHNRRNLAPTLQLDYDAQQLAAPFDPTDDDQGVRNDVEIQRHLGSSARVTDDDGPLGVNAVGRYDESKTLNLGLDDDLPDNASWAVHLGTVDEQRYPAVSIDLAASPELIDAWLNMDIGRRLTAANLPADVPPDDLDALMQGYTEALSPFAWKASMNCSPASPWDVFTLEHNTRGRLDTGGSVLAAAFVAGTDTSMQVATTRGPLWTPDDTQDPFDIGVSGARLTVTDVAAPSAPAFAVGAAAHANNANVTPTIPSHQAGDLLLTLAAIRNSGAGVPNTPAGWTRWAVFPTTANVQVFAKLAASGAETNPTISFTGGVANADTSAQVARFRGNYHDLTRLLVGATHQVNDTVQDVGHPPLRVREDHCLIVYIGWKQDDWTSVATLAGATEIGEPDTTTGDDQGIVWDYLAQTTATDVAAGSFVVTGGAAALSRGAILAIRQDKQTFTVTQAAVNGVAKSIPAGEPVGLWKPAVLARSTRLNGT